MIEAPVRLGLQPGSSAPPNLARDLRILRGACPRGELSPWGAWRWGTGRIIDTSAIVDLERASSNWERLFESAGDEPVFLAAIGWGELMAGVHLADSVPRALRRRERLDHLREHVPILPFTAEIAELWAELFAELQRAGTPLPANDLCIASTAVVHGHAILVSSSVEIHYRRIARAEVVTL